MPVALTKPSELRRCGARQPDALACGARASHHQKVCLGHLRGKDARAREVGGQRRAQVGVVEVAQVLGLGGVGRADLRRLDREVGLAEAPAADELGDCGPSAGKRAGGGATAGRLTCGRLVRLQQGVKGLWQVALGRHCGGGGGGREARQADAMRSVQRAGATAGHGRRGVDAMRCAAMRCDAIASAQSRPATPRYLARGREKRGRRDKRAPLQLARPGSESGGCVQRGCSWLGMDRKGSEARRR